MSYGGLWLVLMKCSWILVNTCGNATMRHDEYGFWVVNHCQRVPAHVKPYVFPSIVSQISPCYCYENLANHEQWSTYHMHFLAKENGLYNNHNYKVKIKLGFLVNSRVDMAWMKLDTLSYFWQDWPCIYHLHFIA
jgi:hypothetical protein